MARLKFFAEVLGLSPLRERLRQGRIALSGAEDVPPAQMDLSSLAQLRPMIGLPLWLGRHRVPRRVIVSNLFNHRQTPIENGWSVKMTQLADFRGRRLTYDSHNGTDFAVPVGSRFLAAAPGKVVRVVSEFNRGGLKIFVDHGGGLMTNGAHLARALVEEGDIVRRGDCLALTGYSGLDGASTFPWGVPHVHYNVWLNGEPIDPFPVADQSSIWAGGGMPQPIAHPTDEPFQPSQYDAHRVAANIDACLTESCRRDLSSIPDLERRGARCVIEMNYYPTRFPERHLPYAESSPRSPRLSLPFAAAEFDGLVFADDL
jgi:murein DD-endopeptidase MepM/ murein hydrolase activator NlpD